jgi:acetyl esterase/lipase
MPGFPSSLSRWLFALLPLFAAFASGCTSLPLAIANTPAAFGKYKVDRDIAYGENAAQRLDVYRPTETANAHSLAAHSNVASSAQSSVARPIIVFMHGGGWTDGSKGQYRFVADTLNARGYVVVTVGYRPYPEVLFPAFVEDGARAVQWVHQHGAEFGGDTSRLYLMGHSAGAHIAAMLTFDSQYLQAVGGDRSWVKGFIGLAGPYDFLPLKSATLKRIFGPESRYAASQPINFVDGDEPPALLLHGLADTTVWPLNSEHLAARIHERGGRVEEHYYEGMSHGGILAALSVYFRNRRTVLQDIERFASP